MTTTTAAAAHGDLVFPIHFFSRDRHVAWRAIAKEELEMSAGQADLLMVKLWYAYAQSGVDRMPLERARCVISAVGSDGSDEVMRALEKAGLLECEEGAVVLFGFFPLNRHLSVNYIDWRSRAGLSSRLMKKLAKSEKPAAEILRLKTLQAGTNPVKESRAPDEQKLEAIRFVLGLREALDLGDLTASQIDGYFQRALQLVQRYSQDQRTLLMRYIYFRKEDITKIPRDLPELLARADEFVVTAERDDQVRAAS